MKATIFRSGLIAVLAAVAFAAAPAVMASAKSGGSHAKPRPSPSPTSSPSPAPAGPFSVGQMQASTVGATGCGTNSDGEPTIHVSPAGNLFLGSERGLGGGSDGWRQVPTTAGSGASACSLVYAGQPNAVAGVGASGGDIDSAWGSALNSAGTYTLYVSSLNLGSVSVAHSTDDGATFTNVPVQGGLPGDDREWIAAYGADTSLLTFHDITTNDIDVLRSDNGGGTYTEISQAIPLTDYKAGANELGNLVIDHRNSAGTVAGGGGPGFWAYQSFVAPSTSSGSSNNEAFVAVSNDGGYTWTDQPVPCSVSSNSLDHNFPNVSVAPDGTLWMSWSDDTNVFTASSGDHGSTWSCSSPASTNTVQAIFPWIVATSAGEDLVYYGTTTSGGKGSNQTWYVYFVQNTGSGWGVPQQVVSVHSGSVCESGISCTGGRQLFDDFGVDTDQQGWAHIAYSHDSPDLGGSGTYTGYAVQTGGTQVGYPN